MKERWTRREFLGLALRIAGGFGLTSLLVSCKEEFEILSRLKPKSEPSEPFTPKPSKTLEVAKEVAQVKETVIYELPPTSKPTSTPEPIKVPEPIIHLPRVSLTGEFLTEGLKGIGAGERISLTPTPEGKEEQKDIDELLLYTSKTWNEEIELSDLSKNPTRALKFLLSLGAYGGFEKTTYGFKEAFPELTSLNFFRFTVENLPNGESLEKVINASPQEAVLRKGTHLTLVGTSADESGRWAVVSFDEGFEREKKGFEAREVPRQYLAVISQDLLKELFKLNNIQYQEGKISFKDTQGRTFLWQPNTIEKSFAETLEEEAGVWWMDQKPDGSWYENPVVPYPPEALVGQNWKIVKTKEGRIVALDLKEKELAEAKYNSKTKKWEWEKIVEKLAAPKIEGLIYNEKEKKYYAQKENLYGLKEGVYAGETIEYLFNSEKTIGVVLTANVVKVLMEKVNTPEAIARGEWKIPFPLDARGERNLEIKGWVPGVLYYRDFVVKGISREAKISSPFLESVMLGVGNSPGYGPAIDVEVPPRLTGSREHYLLFKYPTGGGFHRSPGLVSFDELILWGVGGTLGSKAPAGSQIIFKIGPGPDYTTKDDFDITDNILEINGKMVFLAARSS